jgi:hypothetical protein
MKRQERAAVQSFFSLPLIETSIEAKENHLEETKRELNFGRAILEGR